MVNTFSIKQTPKLYFGPGTIRSLPSLARTFGTNLLFVTGKKSFTTTTIWQETSSTLQKDGFSTELAHIENEPSPEDINSFVSRYTEKTIDVVIGIGGGSVIDAGKAISAMLEEQQPVELFLEGVGTQSPRGHKIPYIAIPTTSGTGSEATSNAVITRTGPNGFKKSLRHDNYVPDIAVVDPELTLSCPPAITTACGMDCYTQLVEAYLSTNGNPYTDALALDGIQRVSTALPAVIANPEDIEARSAMSYGTYLSGIVLANAGLGTIHGFASTIGGYCAIPHGVVCGTLMAETNKATLQKLRYSHHNEIALDKYTRLGRAVNRQEGLTDEEYQDAFIQNLAEFTDQCGIDRLGNYGLDKGNLETIAARTGNKYNPVQFSKDELCTILKNRL
ncbi:iron-containing alcohol dehydrogenase [Desulfopila sp. IMCC35008]|uniref:iron-containing alcohol dehydrogenase n=1 Tax=Desulfopila sp. IMCC35008 TaxID=2653858 RepID=UPI0013D15D2B|nr:iron-containing alcohol dehydrogenase [Desulfopila sp. IMCC35008]